MKRDFITLTMECTQEDIAAARLMGSKVIVGIRHIQMVQPCHDNYPDIVCNGFCGKGSLVYMSSPMNGMMRVAESFEYIMKELR